MINKIIASYILFACLVAIALKLGGVEGTIHLGNYFRAYLVQSNIELSQYKIAIPDIPLIPKGTGEEIIELNNAWDYLRYMWYFAKTNTDIVGILNFFVNVLNILILIINSLIQTIQLVFIFLKNLIVMKENIISA